MTWWTRVTGVSGPSGHSTRRGGSVRVALVLDRWALLEAGWRAGPYASRPGCSVVDTRCTGSPSSSTRSAMPPGLIRHAFPDPRAASLERGRWRPGSRACPRRWCTTSASAGGSISCTSHGGSRRSALRQGLRALPPGRRLRAMLDRGAPARRRTSSGGSMPGPRPHRRCRPGWSRRSWSGLRHRPRADRRSCGTASTPDAFSPAYRERTATKRGGGSSWARRRRSCSSATTTI